MEEQQYPFLQSEDSEDVHWQLSKEVSVNVYVSDGTITDIYYENSDLSVSVSSCSSYSVTSEQGHVTLSKKIFELVEKFAQSHGYVLG